MSESKDGVRPGRNRRSINNLTDEEFREVVAKRDALKAKKADPDADVRGCANCGVVQKMRPNQTYCSAKCRFEVYYDKRLATFDKAIAIVKQLERENEQLRARIKDLESKNA